MLPQELSGSRSSYVETWHDHVVLLSKAQPQHSAQCLPVQWHTKHPNWHCSMLCIPCPRAQQNGSAAGAGATAAVVIAVVAESAFTTQAP